MGECLFVINACYEDICRWLACNALCVRYICDINNECLYQYAICRESFFDGSSFLAYFLMFCTRLLGFVYSHVYKGYLRYVHKKMYWVIDKFEESGFCRDVGDEITQKVFLSNGDIGIVMDLPDHLGSSIRVVGKSAGNHKIWMINSIKTQTNEKALEKVLYELQLYGIE